MIIIRVNYLLCLEYSYKAQNKKVTKYSLNVACYSSENVNTQYNLSSSLDGLSYGTNSVITLPNASISSKVFVSGNSDECLINVYKDSIKKIT